MGQKKLHSILEATTNTVVGYLVAFMTQLVVFPVFGIHISTSTNIRLSIVFTLVSLIRSYCLRRLFNRWHIVEHTKTIQAPSEEGLLRCS